MDQATRTMIVSLLVALGGWLATAHIIKGRQKWSDQVKKMLIIPAWFPWMGVAMGAPVAQGQVALFDAFKAVVSFSFGMMICLYFSRRSARRS